MPNTDRERLVPAPASPHDPAAPQGRYSVSKPGSLATRVAAYQRRRMYAAFLKASGIEADDTVLDVGVTSDQSHEHSNYLVAWYPHKGRITAIGVEDARHLADWYPGVTVCRGSGLDLPFADASFDWVHSSAVLEHVGNAANQTVFIREMRRVARKGIFLTTPNRWFPIEFHTVLPLLHWLPKGWHRRVLRGIGQDFFAAEENLNLLSRGELRRFAHTADFEQPAVRSVSLLGWPSNLLLMATKSA